MHKKILPGSKPAFRPDETIGSYDPLPNEKGEVIVACDLNKFCYYIGKGSQPSNAVEQLLGIAGFWPMHPKLFINAWRRRDGKPVRGGLFYWPDATESEKEDKEDHNETAKESKTQV